METKITPEQQKQLNKLSRNFLLRSILTGISNGIMLCLINFILVMATQIFELSSFVSTLLVCVAGFAIIRRMLSISGENYDIFVKEAKKIIDPK